jgi:hypothetical protein
MVDNVGWTKTFYARQVLKNASFSFKLARFTAKQLIRDLHERPHLDLYVCKASRDKIYRLVRQVC